MSNIPAPQINHTIPTCHSRQAKVTTSREEISSTQEITAHNHPVKGHLCPLNKGTAEKYLVRALPRTHGVMRRWHSRFCPTPPKYLSDSKRKKIILALPARLPTGKLEASSLYPFHFVIDVLFLSHLMQLQI